MHLISTFPSDLSEEPALLRRPVDDPVWNNICRKVQKRYAFFDGSTRQILASLASMITSLIHLLDPVMDELCKRTCRFCSDICCVGSEVYYNETDLFYFAACGKGYPRGQTRRTGEVSLCRYWYPCFGCLLPRSQRPYTCTWFICSDQSQLLETLFKPRDIRRINASFESIRRLRLILSSIFMKSGDLGYEFSKLLE
ncbi:hypothetical protein [Thermodesulforhabdus norvegica]|uniref:hypothetical protein n=1 Tax=Thermodesulforhabdus norvegica TaxID=39841 RepID=UPI000B82C346|nr:hypothetical protein [Thermodesulforhabdus norvegica]